MKKYFMGIAVVVLAIGFSAFTAKKTATVPAFAGEKWFVFNGTSPGDLNDPSKYSLDGNGSTPTVCPTSTPPYRCEVLAQPTGSPAQPILSSIISEKKRNTP